MDVARDLDDHQLIDPHGKGAGRVDDLYIDWDAPGGEPPRLGPLLTGGGVILDELGRLGSVVGGVLRVVGARRLLTRHELPWGIVASVDRNGVHIFPAREDLPTLAVDAAARRLLDRLPGT